MSKKTPIEQLSNVPISLNIKSATLLFTILIYLAKIDENCGKNYGKLERKQHNSPECSQNLISW